jgi:hypothetical protein
MCAVWATATPAAKVTATMNMARRIVERVMLISSLLARELRKASVREAFAKAFRGKPRQTARLLRPSASI